MRSTTSVLAPLAVAGLLVGCGDITSLDNYAAPSSMLTGHVVYQGQPVGVRNGAVQLQLWQPEFELNTSIPVYIAQDGSFSATLFDGSYEVNLLDGGPWVDNSTRMPLQINGDTNLDLQVVPYYTVEGESISNVSDVIQATFNIGQVTTSAGIQRVGLYVGVTTLVDRNNNTVRVETTSGINPNAPVSLSVALPGDIRLTPGPDPRTKVYARVGIQAAGKTELIYSQVHEIGL
jgi:Protein of unknown function (DUF3823) N-terminal domain/Domain of unknown function (DUF3823_C)